MPLDVAFSVCPHDCPSTCALEIERTDDGKIGAVRGAKDHPYTAGITCAKVARYAERTHHPGRLTQPLKRRGAKGSDDFVKLSWDAALDEVAEAFEKSADRHGREAVWPYFFAGTMGHVQRDGINRLRHAMGYSKMAATICSGIIKPGWRAGVGRMVSPDPVEIAESDTIVIWGANPVNTQVNLMHHVAAARKARGAKMVSIDPYRNGTAQAADMHLALRPGTDGALACGVMHVLFAEGFADRAYLAKFASGTERLEEHLRERTPEWAAEITGLGADEIRAFARLYGASKRSMIRVGYGFSRSRNGAVNVHAVTCLPTVTGAWQAKGGGAIYNFADAYGLDMTLIEGLDVATPTRILDMSRIGPVLTNDPIDIGDGPPVTAMLIQNTNPMAVAPDSGLVHRGFARDDLFVCVHEQFMTDTASIADIVLPATTFVEHDDLYTGLGQSHLQIAPKAIDPIGEARSNHEVICALARRLGAAHRGFEMTAWEIIDWTLRKSGYPGADELAARRWVDCAPSFEDAHFLNGFGHADGRFQFAPDWSALGKYHTGMPALPDYFTNIDLRDDDHPFRLVTAPSRQFLNTSFTETRTSKDKERRPTAKIHPEDCARIGLEDGGRVRLGNRRGSVVVHVQRFAGLQPGTVVVEGVWPNGEFEEGVGINLLTSSDPAPPAGGAVFHDTAVWVRRI